MTTTTAPSASGEFVNAASSVGSSYPVDSAYSVDSVCASTQTTVEPAGGLGWIVFTALAPAVWGTTYIVTTELLPEGQSLFAALMRSLPAGLIALLVVRQKPHGSWWWKSAVLGVLNMGLFFPLLFLTAQRLPGGVAATLGATQPILVVLLAVAILHEKASAWRIAWGVTGMAGVALVVLGPEARLDLLGIVAGLAGAASMGTGVVLTKRWGRPEGVSALGLAGWQLTAAGLFLLVPALLIDGIPTHVDASAVAGYLWLGIVGALLAYTIWLTGIRRLPVAPKALLGLLSPLVAAILGAVLVGVAIAHNLVKAGHQVSVWNRDRARLTPLLDAGVVEIQSVREVFASRIVFFVLADDAAVRDVFFDSGSLEAAPAGSVHVNLATISPELTEETAEYHAEHGVGYIAAPMFGGVAVAEAGKLNTVAAGNPELITLVQPLLSAISSNTWVVGDTPRQASVVKVAGQVLIASAIQTMSEAVAIGERGGINAQTLVELFTSTITPGPVYSNYGRLITTEKYIPASFTTILGHKDVNLARTQAASTGLRAPVADLLSELLEEAIAGGHKNDDWASLAGLQRKRNSIDIDE